ncbi:MAG: 3-deoxy-D-manno-octulosonate cytidylyltransferase [Cognaticolwellia sp.]|jgi:3-deoxy-D-manno-octulosonate cytidylyltransferase
MDSKTARLHRRAVFMSGPALVVIPARWGSTRLAAKAVAKINGRELVLHVVDRVREGGFEPVVATDDQRIQQICQQDGVLSELTSVAHQSGSDRVWELCGRYPDFPLVINVQGDEPLFDGQALDKLVACFADPAVQVATLAAPLTGPDSASVVKVTVDDRGWALDFTRSSPAGGGQAGSLQHLGCYGFRRNALARFVSLPLGVREQAEKLEQLRLLEAGMPIAVVRLDAAAPSVDTAEDLERVREMMG